MIIQNRYVMANPNMSYRSHQFGDTTLTKVFVGGLAWETPTDEMRAYFQQFGEILEAVIITDNNTGKSKGYGFVTFREAESARRACANPNPVIDGRRANCNIAALGRYQSGSGPSQHGAYSGVPAVTLLSPPPLLPPLIYPPYCHSTYTPDYAYHQAVYNPQVQQPQYYNQMFGTSSLNSPTGAPYFYGYSLQAPRATFSTARAHPMTRPSYIYYPTQMEVSSAYPPTLQNPTFIRPQYYFPSPTTNSDSQTEQHASKEIEDEGTSDTDNQNN